jgi:hypothetical protein
LAKLSSIRVPKTGRPVLKRLADLGDERAQSLAEKLDNGHFRSLAALVDAVKLAVGADWGEDDADALVTHLLSMSTLRTSHGFGAEALADHLTKELGAELKQPDRKILSNRLAGLLGARGFAALAKAVDIAQESDRLLHVSRVITDIRPVFGDEGAAPPMGAIVMHTLRLDYFERSEVKSISFNLNSRDLAQLKRAIERAQEKESTLSGLLRSVELAEFDLLGETDD